jgi:exonuclease SbcD
MGSRLESGPCQDSTRIAPALGRGKGSAQTAWRNHALYRIKTETPKLPFAASSFDPYVQPIMTQLSMLFDDVDGPDTVMRGTTPEAKRGEALRVLFLADTHLGFDLPVRPVVGRRRRGHDFQAMFERALEPALAGQVDLVLHGGDVFHRPRVPRSVVHQAIEPLAAVASRGVPVLVVPGNHERSRIPHGDLALRPGIHVFDRCRTVRLRVGSIPLEVHGFPYRRRDVRSAFPELLATCRGLESRASGPPSVRLVLMHHCVEGATVGPADFTFRHGRDVVRGRDLPAACAAVLSGHIHRHQVLTHGLDGRAWPTPVLYPGSTERTSFAERDEEKGSLLLELRPDGAGGRLVAREFVPLPARPMILHELAGRGDDGEAIEDTVARFLQEAPADAIVRFRMAAGSPGPPPALGARRLRALTPPGLNVQADWLRPRSPGDSHVGEFPTKGDGSAPTAKRL